MSIYLLQIIFQGLGIIFISFVSLFNVDIYKESLMNTNNINSKKDISIVNDVTPYTTLIEYNSKVPSNLSNIITEGIVGLSYVNDNEERIVIQEMSSELVEKGTGAYGLFKGKLTGYGPDCKGCSKVGNVACKTENKEKHSLITTGIYYEDSEYGKVRILSASTYFPCGTTIKITKEGTTPFYAVVLDRGGSMNKAWASGTVWMDLAYESNAMSGSDNLTGRNIEFSVQRWGW